MCTHINLILIHTQELCRLWCIIYVYTHTYKSYFDTRAGVTQIVMYYVHMYTHESYLDTHSRIKLWCLIYVSTHTYKSYFDTRAGITQIVIEELPLVLAEIRGVDKEVDILKSQHAIQFSICCDYLFYVRFSWEISSGCGRRNSNCLLQPDENSEELTH